MVCVPVFPNPTPPAALHFDTPPVLSVLRVLLGNPSVVRVRLPYISAGFLSYGGHSLLRVLPCPSGCLSALRGCFFSCLLWCTSLRLWFFLRRVCLARLLWLQVVSFRTRSNLRFPSRRGLPLGRVRIALASFFLGSICLSLLVSFLFVSTPFLCLVRSWRSLRVVFTRWVQVFFSWCLVFFGVGSFLGRFWFLPVRVAFTLLRLPLVFFGLWFPSRRGLPLGRVPGSS